MMRFCKWLWRHFLTQPRWLALAALTVIVAGSLIRSSVAKGAGDVVVACGVWMLLLAALIYLLEVVGRALPDPTSLGARVTIDIMVVLFLAFFQLLVAAVATSANPSVIAAVATNRGAKGWGGNLTSAVGITCLFAIPAVLVAVPEQLRRKRPWTDASERARAVVPSWLAASAAVLTGAYLLAEHFFGGPLAGPSLWVVLVGGLGVAALLVPAYQFMARSCWEYGVEVILDPQRWRDTSRKLWRELGGAFLDDTPGHAKPVASREAAATSGTVSRAGSVTQPGGEETSP
jgi:hypothetical protein